MANTPLSLPQDQVNAIIQKAMGIEDDYQGHMKSWSSIQGELNAHIQSAHLGQAVQNQMDTAYKSGIDLTNKLGEILSVLKSSSNQLVQTAMDSANQLMKQDMSSLGAQAPAIGIGPDANALTDGYKVDTASW